MKDERVSASEPTASDETLAEERSHAACVAGERNDGLRGRGTQSPLGASYNRCERVSASERAARRGLRGRGTQ